MWVIASVCPTVGSQLGQIPCKISAIFAQYAYHMAKGEDLGFLSRPLLLVFIKYTGNTVKIGMYMVLSRPFKFLSRPLHSSV